MTTVPPGPYSAPPIDPASKSTTDAKKVSSAGYWIAAAIFVIGAVVAVVWFVVSIMSAVNAPDDFARVDVPGQMRVELASGEWLIYHEYPGADNGFTGRLEPDVEVLDPSGDSVSVRTSSLNETYSNTDHEGRAIGKFDADTAGVYTVIVSGDTQRSEQIAIGRPLFDGGVILGIIGSSILGVVTFLVALILLIITIVRRSKAKKARTGGGLPPAGYVPPYPGAPLPGAYGSGYGPPPAATGYGTPPAPGGHPPAYPPPAPTPTGHTPPPSQPPADATRTPGWATPQPASGPIPPPPSAPPAAASPPPSEPVEPESTAPEPSESEPADPDASRSWSPLDGDPNKPGAF